MIEVKNLTYKVPNGDGEKVILDNISCVFKSNCVTAITGHNGSGKSTLTKLIMGIIQPSSGQIFFNDVDITKLSVDERAKLGINYAFQQPISFKGITVKELIDLATGEKNLVAKVCEYLAKVGICAKEYINREFDKSLSGGEQKRIELALALAKKGDCLIFDEPEAGLDLWSFDKLTSLFKTNKCYIIVSHQEKLLEQADEVLVLNKGRIESFGKSKEVLKKFKKVTCGKIDGGSDGAR